MNPIQTIGIIELGNINIKCLIFKINKDNEVEISTSSATLLLKELIMMMLLKTYQKHQTQLDHV